METSKLHRKRRKEATRDNDERVKKSRNVQVTDTSSDSDVSSRDSTTETNTSDSDDYQKRKKRKVKRKKSKHKLKKSTHDESSDEGKRKHHKKKTKKSSKHKIFKKKHKKLKKSKKHKSKLDEVVVRISASSSHASLQQPPSEALVSEQNVQVGPTMNVPPVASEKPKKRSMVPMTREEYEKQQSVIRRVFDPDTGRSRLIKGDGEVIEEIVSYSRQKQINKQATKGDAASFQKMMGLS